MSTSTDTTNDTSKGHVERDIAVLEREETERYPLSHMQMGMLFHSLYAPGSGVYVQQQVCHLSEAVHVPTLEAAWGVLAEQHAILRTAFHVDQGVDPYQVVHRHVTMPFVERDVRDLGAEQQIETIDAYLADDQSTDFDPAEAPVMRIVLFRLAEAEYCMIWTYHHALLDGRSRQMVLDELFTIYDGLVRGQLVEKEHEQPYRRFIEWQHQQDWLDMKPHWESRLAGVSSPTPLLGDLAAHGTGEPEKGDTHELERQLDGELTTSLSRLAEEQEVTLNTIVQGAWALLLSRYSGERDVVFGAVRACRHSGVPDAASMVGLFINTLPIRVEVCPEQPAADWLRDLRRQWVELRQYEQTPLGQILEWTGVSAGTPLFNSTVNYQHEQVERRLEAQKGAWSSRRFQLHQRTQFPLELAAFGGENLLLQIRYDEDRFERANVERMLGHVETLLRGLASDPSQPIGRLPLLTAAEQQRLLVDWNETECVYRKDSCVHHLFEEQVVRTPDKTAVHFGDRQVSYAELNRRANQLARHLQRRGVGPETLVGVYLDRSVDLLVALFGILKAGGAYVPLDPAYPANRISFMVEDAAVPVLLTRQGLLDDLPPHDAEVVCVDQDWGRIATESDENPDSDVSPRNPSYVIYTSGSTGKPKGVVVQHGNVVNFFAGMDQRIIHDPPGVWLAVTSLSFDISVLELFWTLARGFEVVLYSDGDVERVIEEQTNEDVETDIDLSLFYFASAEEEDGVDDKYRLLIEGAKFADQHGFSAVWTPERHFHSFGGLYPNPAVIGAAIAAVTEKVEIRAGSCVLPLHSPIRVAEEWAVVDNLSNGRVGLSIASGWQPNDFVLNPENFADRKEMMFRDIETVQRLWAGEGVMFPGPGGNDVEVRTLPRPVQVDIPIWVTAAGNPETFEMAGTGGYRLLTHLLGQTVEELAEKLAIYRKAWREAGHPGSEHVSLMLHTYVGDDIDDVRDTVRAPMTEYLRSAVGLINAAAESFPLLKERAAIAGRSPLQLLESGGLSDDDMEALLAHAFERYFEASGLFGTPQSCMNMVEQLKRIGVDEIACLIDFGVRSESVLEGLDQLDELRELANRTQVERARSIPELISRYDVTHLQCTPSMAGTFTLSEESRVALASLQVLMIGGEALPSALADELAPLVSGDIINMYGPTETTIWSSTHTVGGGGGVVPIGRPIANTQLYVLDQELLPVPVGVAGELVIGGDGVVRGYLDRPELTAERFVENPFDAPGSSRLYRTGDLVRYRSDGTVEFLGRIDHQVKIRGHRIELGEIEEQLVRHDDIQSAVVVALEPETAADGSYLAAYVTTPNQHQPTVAMLREHLLAEVPDFMVPSAFMFLNALPLTPNGKIDRKALPAPTMDRRQLGHTYVAPRSEVERELSELWAEILEVEKVGVHDNFFNLGGNSLQAVRLFAEIGERMGENLPLASLFQAPTIAELGVHFDRAGGGDPISCIVPIQTEGTNPPFFCVHGGDGNVMYYRPLAERLGREQPFYGIQALGLTGDQEPHTSIEEMAAHYVREIQIIQPEGPYLLGGNCNGGTIAFEIAQQFYRLGETVDLVAVFDTQHWSGAQRKSRRERLYHDWQRAEFFVRNLLYVAHADRPQYLRQKWKLLRSRRDLQHELGESSYRYNLEEIIHKAIGEYELDRYPGRVTDYTTLKPFQRRDQAEISWSSIADGGVDRVVMPFFPGSSIEEPFVAQLAQELKAEIARSVLGKGG